MFYSRCWSGHSDHAWARRARSHSQLRGPVRPATFAQFDAGLKHTREFVSLSETSYHPTVFHCWIWYTRSSGIHQIPDVCARVEPTCHAVAEYLTTNEENFWEWTWNEGGILGPITSISGWWIRSFHWTHSDIVSILEQVVYDFSNRRGIFCEGTTAYTTYTTSTDCCFLAPQLPRRNFQHKEWNPWPEPVLIINTKVLFRFRDAISARRRWK